MDSGGGIESRSLSRRRSSTISGNSVQAVGAGIDTQSTTTVQNLTISGNYAGEDGGGITSSEALTVEDSTVSGNGITTLFGGTGGISSGGSTTIEDSTISGNLGATEGGGISNGGTATIQDSTLSGNSALNGGGGGIFNQGTAIVDSTIAGNGLDDSGGAVGGISNAGTVRMQATIVASNGPSHDCYGDITDLGYNIDDDGTCGFTAPSISDSTTIDSTLAPIANNGGPTETIALLSGSPAIGQIPAAECPTTDQRGYRRIPPCDIGAFKLMLVPSLRRRPQSRQFQL